VALQDEQQLGPLQGPVLVGEADAAVDLGEARQTLLDAGHAGEDEPHGAAVELVPDPVEAGGVQALEGVEVAPERVAHPGSQVEPVRAVWKTVLERTQAATRASSGSAYTQAARSSFSILLQFDSRRVETVLA
jgi:hypothetical protein